MIKNYSSIALFIFIFGCSITSDSQSLNSSINPADLYSWVPADASELELVTSKINGSFDSSGSSSV